MNLPALHTRRALPGRIPPLTRPQRARDEATLRQLVATFPGHYVSQYGHPARRLASLLPLPGHNDPATRRDTWSTLTTMGARGIQSVSGPALMVSLPDFQP